MANQFSCWNSEQAQREGALLQRGSSLFQSKVLKNNSILPLLITFLSHERPDSTLR